MSRRAAYSGWSARQFGQTFPWGTLLVNVSGSFLMGLLTELMLQRFALTAEYRAAVARRSVALQ